MKTSSSTEFTARDGRRFGFQVGLAFLGLGVFLVWRERTTPALIAGTASALLLLGGLLRPVALGPVHRAWMAAALAISKVTTPVFMAVVYFLVLTPTGLLVRILGRNPIVHAPGDDGGYWQRRPAGKRGDMRRQF